MKKNSIYLLVVILLTACSNPPKKEVHLKGLLKGLGPKQYVLAYNGVSSFIGKSRDIPLNVNENGYFDTIIPLAKPEYYSIVRNTLYLTPGDDLEIFITQDNTEAEFKGKGAEANRYLKNRLFPHGGSFLESGRNVKEDFASTRRLVDSLAVLRYAETDTLSNVSETFRALEKARITADVINSYTSYASYTKELKPSASGEEIKAFRDKHTDAVAEYVNPLYKQIDDDIYLDVAVVRDVFYNRRYYKNWFAGITETDVKKELYRAAVLAMNLHNEPTLEILEEAKSALPELSDTTIVHELDLIIKKVLTLQPGQPAFDFELTDISGNIKHLSDFRGKWIYIDFWATWCVPCIAESPYLEKLAEKFEGKDIVFLPISTDNTVDVWLKYLANHEKKLAQYYTADPNYRNDWNLWGIPRFILIDKELKIVNAYAPRPSEEEAEKLLNAL